MGLSDTKAFLTDLLTRFDPNLDVTEGSRVQSELVDPILSRVGGDPFDDDFVTFIRTRMQQARPDLAITEADELTDLLIDPMRILIEPLTREIQLVKLRTSLNNLDALADDEVDALMANFFEARKAGGYAVGVARAYFAARRMFRSRWCTIAQSRGGCAISCRVRSDHRRPDDLERRCAAYYFDINYSAKSR